MKLVLGALLALLLGGGSQPPVPQSAPSPLPPAPVETSMDGVDSYLKAAFSGEGESEPGPLFQRSQLAFLRKCKNPKYLAGPLEKKGEESSCLVRIDDLKLDGQQYQGEMQMRLNQEGRISSSSLVLKRRDGTVLNLYLKLPYDKGRKS